MSKIVWDKTGERFFEWGIDRVVLYPKDSNGDYQTGVPWNGVVRITESPSGFQANAYYFDNVKYMTATVTEEYSATIEALGSPKEFAECDGSIEAILGLILRQQTRREFGLSYRTFLGNDINGPYHGYKLHLVYDIAASASKRNHKSSTNGLDALVYSWPITTKSSPFPNYNPIASIVLESTKMNSLILTRLERILYGSDGPEPTSPRLPLPSEVLTASYPLFTVGITKIGSSQIDPIN